MGSRIRKPRNGAVDYIQYLAMRWAGMIIQMASPRTALRVARFLGRGMHRFYGRGRERALEHLRASYPEKNSAWIEQTAQRSFEHLAMLAFDVFLTPRLVHPSTLDRFFEVDFEQLAPVFDWINARQAVIMVTGHYGSFEVLGFAMAAHGIKIFSVGRPIDNPFIDGYLRRTRQRRGQVIIDKKGAAGQMTEILSSGHVLGLVADQNGSKKDVFVDFFGRKAATYKSIGLLAMRYDAPIVIGYCRRLKDDYRFSIGLSRIIRPADWRDRDNPLEWITAEYTRGIEEFVREDPEQYWWLHRRWKTRPLAERARNK